MISVARLIQEKCREQHRDLFIAFVDLATAFETECRALLWQTLEKFGCQPKYITILRKLHDGGMARVIQAGRKSDPFEVASGVRQGCVLASVIFNIFMAGIMRLAAQNINAEDCLSIRYRLEGNLFNNRRLKARTLTSETNVFDLQYADDAALVGSSSEGL